jgi:hypothetical protein
LHLREAEIDLELKRLRNYIVQRQK